MPDTPPEMVAGIKAAFQAGDTNGDGFISIDVLKQVLGQLDNWSAEEFAVLFNSVDKNADGKLSYNKFVDWVMQSQCVEELGSSRSEVHIVDMAGNAFGTFALFPDEYIIDFKKRLTDVKDIHAKHLVLQDIILQDDLRFQDCSVAPGATITLVTKGWPEAMDVSFRTPTIDAGFRIVAPAAWCDKEKCTRPEAALNSQVVSELKNEQVSQEFGEDFGTIKSWFACIHCGAPATHVDANPFRGVYKTASAPSKRKVVNGYVDLCIVGGGPQDEVIDEDKGVWIRTEGLVTDDGPGQPQKLLILTHGPIPEDEEEEREVLSTKKGTWTGRGILWDDGSFWEWTEQLWIDEE